MIESGYMYMEPETGEIFYTRNPGPDKARIQRNKKQLSKIPDPKSLGIQIPDFIR